VLPILADGALAAPCDNVASAAGRCREVTGHGCEGGEYEDLERIVYETADDWSFIQVA